MFFDPLYLLVIGAGMLLSLWASAKVKGTFAKYSRMPTTSRMTGADVARQILARNRIDDVRVEQVRGSLSDHYDPRSKKLRLSEPVYGSNSMAAFGVAAHEVGHAIQHAQGYAPLKFRSAWVPVANLGGGISMFVIILAFLMGGVQTAAGNSLAILGVALFAPPRCSRWSRYRWNSTPASALWPRWRAEVSSPGRSSTVRARCSTRPR